MRTIVFYQCASRIIFVHGFIKNDKSNLNKKEALAFNKLSDILLAMSNTEFTLAIKNGDFVEIVS